MKLRPYQTRTISCARSSCQKGRKRLFISSPTGSGKTEIGFELIRGALAKGKRVAFVANRIGLVGQASRRLHAAGIRHGIVQGANSRAIDEAVLVCSIQTISRRGLPPVDLIVIDEAHACPGSKDYRRLFFLNNAVTIIGLSATPFSKGLGQNHDELGGPLFEELIVASTIRELIELGYLVDVEIFAPSTPDLTGVRVQKNAFGEMDFSEKDLAQAVDKPSLVGDIVGHWKRLGNDQPTVCFATSIAHSRHIVEQFLQAGISAEHLDCYTDDAERAAILDRVKSGQTRIVSNVGILTEGWDFPACSVMILARPTRSLIRYVQMAGRILRPYPGKEKGLILDHSGSSLKLGYPTDDLPLELDAGKPRSASPKSEPKAPEPSVCPSCTFLKPPKIHACPKCGFAPERQNTVETVKGKLVQVKRKAKPGEKQRVYSELVSIAEKHGYREGWVAHKYRTYFGAWPKGLQWVGATPSQEIQAFVICQQIKFAKGVRRAA